MSEVAEKLYPPIIGRSIPAFYLNDKKGVAELTIPFSMNRAVDAKQILGFRLLLKTIQGNKVITTIDNINIAESLETKKLIFEIPQAVLANIQIGQFIKAQVAYISLDETPGYFSTIGVVKYTSKPKIYIDGMLDSNNLIFKRSYVGVYEITTDKTERPYSYIFNLYDNDKKLVETSGWQLHNTELSELGNAYTVDQAIDTYSFQSALVENERYYITYSVRTINNLEISTIEYPCMELYGGETSFLANFNVENIFEDGYINLSFDVKNYEAYINEDFSEPVSIAISRADSKDNFKSWRIIKKVYFTSYANALDWEYNDFIVEQGIYYQYGFQQYNTRGFFSERIVSDKIMADFEDMFLWDGKRQLKIKYNPGMSSFKTTILQQKIDTIGNKFPFTFRNGLVAYKEFPLSGLISYWQDNNELFLDYNQDLGIQHFDYSVRDRGGKSLLTPYEKIPTTDFLDYNIKAERQFKLEVLDWLNNGEIKFFRSPTEGNYLIQLMSVQLSPENQLGRMLHNFSANAYEVEEFTYENLVKLKFLDIEEPSFSRESIKSIDLETIIKQTIGSISEDGSLTSDQLELLNSSIKLNSEDIINLLKIDIPIAISNQPYIIFRTKERNIERAEEKKVFVKSGHNLNLEGQGNMPDIYFNFADNFNIENINILSILSMLKNINITYKYSNSMILTGNFNGIKSMYVQSYSGTYFNKKSFMDIILKDNTYTTEEPIKLFKLKFHKKEIKIIYRDTTDKGEYKYYVDKRRKQEVLSFSPIYLYLIIDITEVPKEIVPYNSSYQFTQNTLFPNFEFQIINEYQHNKTYESFEQVLDLTQEVYDRNRTSYYIYNGSTYNQCSPSDDFDSSRSYYNRILMEELENHNFEVNKAQDKITYTCRDCGFSYEESLVGLFVWEEVLVPEGNDWQGKFKTFDDFEWVKVDVDGSPVPVEEKEYQSIFIDNYLVQVPKTKIKLIYNNKKMYFQEIPILNLAEIQPFQFFSFTPDVYVDCAYLAKITIFDTEIEEIYRRVTALTEETFNNNKTMYYIYNSTLNSYIQCDLNSVYNKDIIYYTKLSKGVVINE